MNITKKITSLFVALSLISVLAACTKDSPDATELLFEILNDQDELPAYEIYYSGAPSYSKNLLTPETSELLYRDTNMPSYAESFACALGEDDAVWEIHIFVALSASDAGFIENALEKRLNILQNREIYIYDPEIYEKRIEDAKVFRSGKVVCLVVCDDNIRILKKIKRL